MVFDKTLYERLGVAEDATLEEIESKGKQLLKLNHPDKNPNDKENAKNRFISIQEALNCLKDTEKRALYDKYGMKVLKNDFVNEEEMGNPFGNMFGGGMFGGGSGMFGDMFGGRHKPNEEMENITHKLSVKLEQIYKEEDIEFKYKQKVYCVDCNGEGTNDGTKSECVDCKGKGFKVQLRHIGPNMVQQVQSPCNPCKGMGKITPDKNKCKICSGAGFNVKDKTFTVKLESGMSNGVQMKAEGKGNHFKNTKTDLIILLEEKKHSVFTRNGSDLIVNVELKLYQALFGFDKVITHLDGRKLHLHHTGVTQYGAVRKISNEGMKDIRTKTKGNLIINFTFTLPKINSDTLVKALSLLDKNEQENEKTIKQDSSLVKTMMIDISNYNQKQQDSDSDGEQNQRQGRQQCQQQ